MAISSAKLSGAKISSIGVPLWLKLLYSAFVVVLVPYYWWTYGPTNFLYFCDVALLMTVVGIWTESPLLVSMTLVGILLPQPFYFTLMLVGMPLVIFGPAHWFLRLVFPAPEVPGGTTAKAVPAPSPPAGRPPA